MCKASFSVLQGPEFLGHVQPPVLRRTCCTVSAHCLYFCVSVTSSLESLHFVTHDGGVQLSAQCLRRPLVPLTYSAQCLSGRYFRVHFLAPQPPPAQTPTTNA